jgi:prepilin-type N-terminal cleavage/methylation domain-containing protein/prepilin-type processing-associated H-X9-DG protein
MAQHSRGVRRRAGRGGFTLVELLVVIGIIALLISILMPALNKVKVQAQRTACMSNTRQLAMAWQMYSNDNKDFLPMNWPDGSNSGLDPAPSKFVPWFVGKGRASTLSPPLLKGGGNNDEAIIRGAVYPYLKSIKVYKCPGDQGLRLVSYGVNCYLNGEAFGDMVFKRAKVKHHSKTFILIDEYDFRNGDADGYNLGAFALNPKPSNTWVDYPGMFHQDASVIAFLDGHAEVIQWIVKTTRYITGNNTDASADTRDIRKLQGFRGGAAVD